MIYVEIISDIGKYHNIKGKIFKAKYSEYFGMISYSHYDIYLPNGLVYQSVYESHVTVLSEKEVRKYKIEQLMNRL